MPNAPNRLRSFLFLSYFRKLPYILLLEVGRRKSPYLSLVRPLGYIIVVRYAGWIYTKSRLKIPPPHYALSESMRLMREHVRPDHTYRNRGYGFTRANGGPQDSARARSESLPLLPLFEREKGKYRVLRSKSPFGESPQNTSLSYSVALCIT